MRPITLKATGFKGLDFEHKLPPIWWLYGENFVGKSARIEALMLAMAGYVPGCSSRASDIFATFGNGSAMEVEVKTDTGALLAEYFTQHRDKVKHRRDATEMLPPVALDPTEFLALSGPDKIRFVLERCKLGAEITVEKLSQALIAGVKNIKIEENTPESEAVIKVTVKQISDLEKVSESPLQFIKRADEWTGNCLRAARDTVKRMEQTSAALTQLTAPEATPMDATEKQQAAQAANDAAQRSFATVQAQQNVAFGQLHELRKKPNARDIDEQEVRKQMADLSAKKERMFKATAMPRPYAGEAEAAVNKLVTRKGDLQTTLNMAAEYVKTYREQLASLPVSCNECGRKFTKAQLKTQAAKIQQKEKDALGQENEARAGLQELEPQISDAEQTLKDINVAIAAFDEKVAEFRRLSNEHAQLQGLLDAVANATRIKELEKELELKKIEVESAQKIAVDRTNDLAAANDLVRRHAAVQAEYATRAKARREAAAAKLEVQVLTEVSEGVRKLQDHVISGTIEPLLKTANELLTGILPPGGLVYRDGMLGLMRGEKFVPCKRPACSGTEEALTWAALSLALAVESPSKFVILDEIGRLSPARREILVTKLVALKAAGLIDGAVCVCADDQVPDPGDWEHFGATQVS